MQEDRRVLSTFVIIIYNKDQECLQNRSTSALGLENMLPPQTDVPETFGQSTIDSTELLWNEPFVRPSEIITLNPNTENDESFASSSDMRQVSHSWGGAGAPMLLSPDCKLLRRFLFKSFHELS